MAVPFVARPSFKLVIMFLVLLVLTSLSALYTYYTYYSRQIYPRNINP
jgi:hypothetical protein